jgi:hypothetical protein
MSDRMSDISFSEQILDFYFNLPQTLPLTEGVELIYPWKDPEVQEVMQTFFHKYYDDTHPRTYLIGINPGRLGSGVTGIGFTDSYHLEAYCDIPNSFDKRKEASATFMFEVIAAYGGVEAFYKDFFFTTTMPLGLLKNGKNYNYYDDKETLDSLEPFIEETLLQQMSFTRKKPTIICVGQGKNLKYLQAFNARHDCFESIEVVPHPRWVMQYRRKEKEKYIEMYLEILTKVKNANR